MLLDCQMPLLSGMGVLAKVRQNEKETGAAPVPVVMHSASLMDERVVLELGGNGFVEKPFTETKLRMALKPFFPEL